MSKIARQDMTGIWDFYLYGLINQDLFSILNISISGDSRSDFVSNEIFARTKNIQTNKITEIVPNRT